MAYYIDIDGTLTDDGKHPGNPVPHRVKFVQGMISSGYEVVIWSARGRQYATEFCRVNEITGATAILGKPIVCVDDWPNIQKEGLRRMSPEDFFKG